MLLVIYSHCVQHVCLNGAVLKRDITHISHLLLLTNGTFIKPSLMMHSRSGLHHFTNICINPLIRTRFLKIKDQLKKSCRRAHLVKWRDRVIFFFYCSFAVLLIGALCPNLLLDINSRRAESLIHTFDVFDFWLKDRNVDGDSHSAAVRNQPPQKGTWNQETRMLARDRFSVCMYVCKKDERRVFTFWKQSTAFRPAAHHAVAFKLPFVNRGSEIAFSHLTWTRSCWVCALATYGNRLRLLYGPLRKHKTFAYHQIW